MQAQSAIHAQPGRRRTFDVTTRVDTATPHGATQVWLPTRCVNSNWRQPLQTGFNYPISAKAIYT
ncbi:MAG: hypothetical protein GZ093_10540 [Rhodoferax sp.]|uniref:hypothetical protein n=1 Tax=Rhodoferax sp. TaxID=50421 RepID=UPI0014016D42|nr:hypothetical protein [Rhodoferax sp.]NDP39168.1 hypothetical protein [Rhodoferax sp.]